MNLLLLTFIAISFGLADSYLPVLLFPGLGDIALGMEFLCLQIKLYHRGTFCKVIQPKGTAGSFLGLWEQVEWYRKAVQPYFKRFPNGLHFLAYSQGCDVARAVIQTTANHPVKNFINLAGPNVGMWGIPETNRSILGVNLQKLLAPTLSNLFYTNFAQNILSIAGLWNDPTRPEDFMNKCKFINILNNLKDHSNYDAFKTNFERLNKTVYYHGDKDTTIIPLISTEWGYIDKNGKEVPMKHQYFYKNNTFGLATKDKNGDLIIETIHGAGHNTIIANPTYVPKFYMQWLY